MSQLSCCNAFKFYFSELRNPFSNETYALSANKEKCHVSYRDTIFCVFEDIKISTGKVDLGHFSVNEPFRGCLIGELCLRKFAAGIAKLDSEITTIEFSLYKLPTNFPHQKIGQARLDLLNRIGATGTSMKLLPQGNYLVSGSWNKSKWKK